MKTEVGILLMLGTAEHTIKPDQAKMLGTPVREILRGCRMSQMQQLGGCPCRSDWRDTNTECATAMLNYGMQLDSCIAKHAQICQD